MINLTILGCMAGAPARVGPASGYLLETGGQTILIDCGSGVVAALAALNVVDKLDAVLISHRHADHCVDLVALAYARLFPNPLPPLPMFGPVDLQATLEGLNQLFAIPSLGPLQQPLSTALPFTALAPEHEYVICGLRLVTHQTQHPVETLAYKFSELSFGYTADGSLTPELVSFAKGCDTILAEATYLKDTAADLSAHGHMTSLDAARLATWSGAKNLIITHFANFACIDQSLAEARSCFSQTQAAYPMLKLTLRDK